MYRLEILEFMFDRNNMPGDRAIRLFQQPGNSISLPSPDDAIVNFKIGQGPRNASLCDVARRSNDHRVLDSNLTGDQVSRVVKIANAYREFDVFANKVDPSVSETYVEMQRRIALCHFK